MLFCVIELLNQPNHFLDESLGQGNPVLGVLLGGVIRAIVIAFFTQCLKLRIERFTAWNAA